MIPQSNLLLHWDYYRRLAGHVHTLNERSALRTKLSGWLTALQDYTSATWDMTPSHDKLSDISAGLISRLEEWAIIPDCAYTRATRQLMVRLNFTTDNVVDPDYVYLNDDNLKVHVELQLAPAFDIIKRYLKVGEVGSRVIRPLELCRPVAPQDTADFMLTYREHYSLNSATGTLERVGMPYAMSVFLTYASFDF
jgi:hypothetical protein